MLRHFEKVNNYMEKQASKKNEAIINSAGGGVGWENKCIRQKT